eukprot:scaffold38507_cov314-Skeletonema_marinoi.AAC.1
MPNEYIPSPPLSLLHDMILLFPPVYELVPSPPLPLLFVILYYVLLQSAILWPTSPSEASTSEGHGSLPPPPPVRCSPPLLHLCGAPLLPPFSHSNVYDGNSRKGRTVFFTIS